MFSSSTYFVSQAAKFHPRACPSWIQWFLYKMLSELLGDKQPWQSWPPHIAAQLKLTGMTFYRASTMLESKSSFFSPLTWVWGPLLACGLGSCYPHPMSCEIDTSLTVVIEPRRGLGVGTHAGGLIATPGLLCVFTLGILCPLFGGEVLSRLLLVCCASMSKE